MTRFSLSDRTSYASVISRNFISASLLPWFLSGWYCTLSLR